MAYYHGSYAPVKNVALAEVWPLSAGAAIIPCEHTPHQPRFEPEACKYQSPEWVRQRYPRYDSICSVCKQRVRLWASIAHMQALGE
jgi:hypothetical protein